MKLEEEIEKILYGEIDLSDPDIQAEKSNLIKHLIQTIRQHDMKRIAELDKQSFTLGRVRWWIELDDIRKIMGEK